MSTWFTFDRILDPTIDFPLTQNLPFHFCTIVTFLLVPAVWFRHGWWVRPLHALLFFPGAVAGFAALASPGDGYAGMPLLHMNTLFYVVHGLNWVLPVLLVSLGYYRPTVRDAVMSLGTFVALGLAVLPITLAERVWVDPGANYFYMFDPEGAGVLVALWDLIGIPFVYELPLLPLVLPVLLLQVGLHRGFSAVARRRARFAPAALEPHQVMGRATEVR
jgi:uncharacterized membrane protein YwaF